ncbi:MAG: TolC family protein [Alphaproteobacteria bacterium]|nr:TolC family protein [Alphaproteobacteria bacterium]
MAKSVKKQYLSGLTDTLAYEQSLSVLHTSEMQLPLLKTQEKQAKNALAVLVGILPSEIAEISNNILSKQIAVDKELIHSLPVDIINNRPDVQIAEQQLIAQNALIREALSNLFPQISLSYLFGYQNQNLGLLINKDLNMYSLNSGITLPLFHWGALTNQIDLRKSQTEQALSLYKATLLTAVADISNTQTSLLQELKRNNSTQKNVRSATEILTLSRRKYKNGLTDFSDVLTAEQNKLSAEQTHLQSNADIYLYQIAFYKSVGGGINFNHKIQVCRKDDKESACVHDKD